ncbi:DUF6904 family protein [Alicyclobacillus acidocaldarius]|uniref:Uncharacterized protein n=1 Tax=Alicyclobacillus acidocaldarius (strain Tc-4-1) TaxID=1048834 RepID=F8IJ51_ALIAT|nr:hypothetical protein [Alicyclobacillus acidocaldarius]AEJ42202.1 hypothetical protein TC41_0226 [Alicyclobacillus acidocaldarius subsp. acidocaldarius Tc-4-1]
MLRAKNTANLLGIEVSGDYDDLQALYHALHEVVGEEGEYPASRKLVCACWACVTMCGMHFKGTVGWSSIRMG